MSKTIEVTLVGHDETKYRLDVELGQTIMEAAVIHGVPGILAECGGAPQCGTCSVFVADPWRDAVGIAENLEIEVLRMNNKLHTKRRLSCEMIAERGWDGLVLHIPEKQY